MMRTRLVALLLVAFTTCVWVTGCDSDSKASKTVDVAEARANCDAFASYFDEQYALFDLRLPGRDWNDLSQQACDEIDTIVAANQRITKGQLFDLMIRLAENLDDLHTGIFAPDIGFEDDAWVSEFAFFDEVESLESNAEANYIDEPEFSRAAEDEFSWGHIGEIGYLSITSMEGLSPDSADDLTDQDDHTIDVAAAHAAMEIAMADLGDAAGLIVDVRANGGGWDDVSLAVASWFAGPMTVAYTEQRRNGPGHFDFGPEEPAFVEAGVPGAYDGPVILLTSGATISAAEIFTLAMRVRDNVTILGEPGSGHFSDQLARTLPNGWIVDLSNERYRAVDGVIYETIGVPVDMPVPLDVAALGRGVDVMLDAALQELTL